MIKPGDIVQPAVDIPVLILWSSLYTLEFRVEKILPEQVGLVLAVGKYRNDTQGQSLLILGPNRIVGYAWSWRVGIVT